MTSPAPIRAQDEGNHLHWLVGEAISQYGPACDLNHIDVSGVKSFVNLFKDSTFTGNISKWNTASMENASGMFLSSRFNGDISSWNTSRLCYAASMFAESTFNSDISKWDTSSMKNAGSMFCNSQFNSDISNWDTSLIYYASSMFASSKFNGDISKWDMRKANKGCMTGMFYRSTFMGDLSAWRLDSNIQRVPSVDGVFDANFAGIPPTPAGTVLKEFYVSLFGTAANLASYLNNAHFNHVHFDMSCLSERKPIGVNKDDYQWSKAQYELAQSLGLSHADLRTYAMAKYNCVHTSIECLALPELDLTK